MLSLVLGVSVILYIFDVPVITSPTQIVPTIISSPQIIPATASTSKNISASIDYFPEGRSESITVSLIISNSTISEMTVKNSMNDGKSRQYQLAFESEIQSLVVGKDVKSLNLSRVAGASITTDAFMQAVDKIKSQI